MWGRAGDVAARGWGGGVAVMSGARADVCGGRLGCDRGMADDVGR
jgi:hypothetical protein